MFFRRSRGHLFDWRSGAVQSASGPGGRYDRKAVTARKRYFKAVRRVEVRDKFAVQSRMYIKQVSLVTREYVVSRHGVECAMPDTTAHTRRQRSDLRRHVRETAVHELQVAHNSRQQSDRKAFHKVLKYPDFVHSNSCVSFDLRVCNLKLYSRVQHGTLTGT